MTTKVTSVYDALVTLIGTTLSTYTKIINPYIPEDNSELFLVKGYGVGFGNGENTERQLSCKLSVLRTFKVILVNQVVLTDHDELGHASLEKTILEDSIKILSALETNTTLNGNAIKSIYRTDSGIEFLEGDRSKYLLLEIDIECEYFEDL
jgi:hypothetical protein